MNNDIVLTSSMFDTVKIAEPLGLECLSAVLKQNAYKVKIIEPCIEGLSIEDMADRINREHSKIVGISLHRDKNINNILKLVSLLRSFKSDYFIIIGGHGPSVGIINNPEIYKSLAQVVDCFILGEGEKTILKIVKAVLNEQRWNDIPGLAFWGNNDFVINDPSEKIKDLDSLPFMQREVLSEFVRIYGNNIPASIVLSRGCAYNKCRYCTVVAYENIQKGLCYRQRSMRNVVEEISFLYHKFGITEFNFEDDNFILPGATGKSRVEEFCNLVNQLDFSITFTFFCRIDYVDYELFSKLVAVGLKGLYIGIESINEETLSFFSKGIHKCDIYNGLNMLRKLGFDTSIDAEKRIMIGYICWHPLTTLDELRATSEFLKEYSLPHKILRRRLRLYSGAQIINDIKALGLLSPETKTGWTYRNPRIKLIEENICRYIDRVDVIRDKVRTIEKWIIRFQNRQEDSTFFKVLRQQIDNTCFEYFDCAVEMARIEGNSFEVDLQRLDNKMYNKFQELVDSQVMAKINDTLDMLNLPQNAVDVFRK